MADYSLEKHETIEKLQEQLNESTARQSDAQAKVNAATSALNLISTKYTSDEALKTTAYNNATLAQKSLSTTELAGEISGEKDGAVSTASAIYSAVQMMTSNAYITASATANLADAATELAGMISQMKKDNSLISDLLVKDSGTLSASGTQALTDAIAAWNACVTALDSASVAVENADYAGSMLDDLVKRCDWLNSQLADILDTAKATAEQADVRKNEAKRKLEEANKDLVKANAQLASDTAALAAANAATATS